MMSAIRFGLRVLAIAVALASTGAGPAEERPPGPRRVVVLHSYALGFEPHTTFADGFHAGLTRASPEPVELFELSLAASLTSAGADDDAFVGYLKTIGRIRPADLVVALGGPAARFVQRHRPELFADAPLLIAGTDTRHLDAEMLSDLDAVVPVGIDVAGLLTSTLCILPATREIVVVLGASPIERFWKERIEAEARPVVGHVRLTYLDDLPFDEVLRRVADLPPGTVVFYASMLRDVDGVPRTGAGPLRALRERANAPIIGVFDSYLGQGILGGPLVPIGEATDRSVDAAVALLGGAVPATQRFDPVTPRGLLYDARELQRWGIDPARLPEGSEIRFRQPGVWEAYGGWILGLLALFVGQAVLIAGLLVQRRRRRRAEDALRHSRERYRVAVDGSNDGLWDWDLRTGEAYYSPRFMGLLGYPEEQRVAPISTWQDRVHPEDLASVKRAIEAHLDRAASEIRVEHRVRAEDGKIRWVLARGKARVDALGRAYRVAGSLTDIDDRRSAEHAVRDLSRRLVNAQEEERKRLARELHDDITQRLARLAIDAGRAEHGFADRQLLAGLRAGLARVSEDVHALSYRLHPSLLEDLGLEEALQVECDKISEQFGTPTRLEVRDVPERIPPAAALCMFRVAQEALRNAGRHAHARSVEVRLEGSGDSLRLEVRDDGIGIAASDRLYRAGLGLSSMRERVEMLAGTFEIDGRPDRGTTVRAALPLPGAPA